MGRKTKAQKLEEKLDELDKAIEEYETEQTENMFIFTEQ